MEWWSYRNGNFPVRGAAEWHNTTQNYSNWRGYVKKVSHLNDILGSYRPFDTNQIASLVRCMFAGIGGGSQKLGTQLHTTLVFGQLQLSLLRRQFVIFEFYHYLWSNSVFFLRRTNYFFHGWLWLFWQKCCYETNVSCVQSPTDDAIVDKCRTIGIGVLGDSVQI